MAGVDRQNENEMANEQMEYVMSNELVVCNEQVAMNWLLRSWRTGWLVRGWRT